MASCSSLSGWVWAALIRVRIATKPGQLGARIGVDRDGLVQVFGFANAGDDVLNAQSGRTDRDQRIIPIDARPMGREAEARVRQKDRVDGAERIDAAHGGEVAVVLLRDHHDVVLGLRKGRDAAVVLERCRGPRCRPQARG